MAIISSYYSVVSFFNWFIEGDKKLFAALNKTYTNSFFDSLMPWWRTQESWYFLYVILLAFVAYKKRWKTLYWLAFVVAAIALTDVVSSHVFKNVFCRLRPCQDAAVQARLLLGRCPTSFSFTSSHAANHFAMAVFFVITLKYYLKSWVYLFLLWAFSIAYAQVYVGVHYPLDVFFGGLTGGLIGYGFGKWYVGKISI